MRALLLGTAAFGSIAAEMAAAQPAEPTQRWFAFASDDEVDYSYDAVSVVRSGGNVTYRMRAVMKEERERVASAVVSVEIDCRAQTTALHGYTLYDRSGTVLREVDVPAGSRSPERIDPATPEEVLYRSLCPERLVRPIQPPPMMRVMTVAPPAPPPVMMAPMAPPIRMAPPVPPLVYPPAPPPPPSRFRSRAQWVTPPSALLSDLDYPAAALRNEEQGTVTVRLQIARVGRVTGCTIIGSSGSSILDAATCRLFTMRARFRPARNLRGRPVEDHLVTRVVWRIPEDLPPVPVPAEPQSQPPEQS